MRDLLALLWCRLRHDGTESTFYGEQRGAVLVERLVEVHCPDCGLPLPDRYARRANEYAEDRFDPRGPPFEPWHVVHTVRGSRR